MREAQIPELEDQYQQHALTLRVIYNAETMSFQLFEAEHLSQGRKPRLTRHQLDGYPRNGIHGPLTEQGVVELAVTSMIGLLVMGEEKRLRQREVPF